MGVGEGVAAGAVVDGSPPTLPQLARNKAKMRMHNRCDAHFTYAFRDMFIKSNSSTGLKLITLAKRIYITILSIQ